MSGNCARIAILLELVFRGVGTTSVDRADVERAREFVAGAGMLWACVGDADDNDYDLLSAESLSRHYLVLVALLFLPCDVMCSYVRSTPQAWRLVRTIKDTFVDELERRVLPPVGKRFVLKPRAL